MGLVAKRVHEIKLDGYRMQLRVAGGEAVMRTRKGLDWTSDFTASRACVTQSEGRHLPARSQGSQSRMIER
jgi:ATP-dependent DNA ligase